jgi:hypothetical protein
MNPRLAWPALGPTPVLPATLEYERAVWGKVHGESSDFRWIARSGGFDSGLAQLHDQLTFGVEDRPAVAQLWLGGGRCLAVGFYRSRAVDSSSRRDSLEKQVLAWRRPPAQPAALGASVLLPHVAALDDEVWWGREANQDWSDPSFSLPIAPDQHRPLGVGEPELAAAIGSGVEALQAVPAQALAALYGHILSGRRPAFLPGLGQPLPPAALAALLLPLPRAIADRLSLAGWVPSGRVPLADLAARWDVVVLPPDRMDLAAAAAAEDPQPSLAGHEERGWALARALLGNDPALAAPARPRGPVAAHPLQAPPAAAPRPPAAPAAGAVPGAELALAAPPRGASPIVLEISAFARAVDHRWLDPELLGARHGRLRDLAPPPEDLFPSWIAALREQRPAHADEEQWLVKVDLLRSAALVLRPGPDALRHVTLPASRRVPALFFALLYERGKRDLLGELGEELLAAALAHSLERIPNRPTRRTRGLIEEWQGETRRKRPRISDLIAQALAAWPRSVPVL